MPWGASRWVPGEHVSRPPRRPRSRPARTGRSGLRGEVGPHLLDLAVGLGEPHHRMRSSSAKRLTAFRNAVWSKTAGHGIGSPQVHGHEADHLPADLQVRHIGVQVDPIQTLQVQRYLPVQDVIHGYRLGHPHSVTAAHLLDQPPTSAGRGGACDTRSHERTEWTPMLLGARLAGRGAGVPAPLPRSAPGAGRPTRAPGVGYSCPSSPNRSSCWILFSGVWPARRPAVPEHAPGPRLRLGQDAPCSACLGSRRTSPSRASPHRSRPGGAGRSSCCARG